MIHVESQEVALCVVKDDCTDLKLQGAELIPSRLNEVHRIDLPTLAVQFNFHDLVVPKWSLHLACSFACVAHRRRSIG